MVLAVATKIGFMLESHIHTGELLSSQMNIYQAVTRLLMYPAEVLRYNTQFKTNELTRATSRLFQGYMVTTELLLRQLAGTADPDITYKKGCPTLKTYLPATWGNNSDSGYLVFSYMAMYGNV